MTKNFQELASEVTWQVCVRCGGKVHINHVDYEDEACTRPYHHEQITVDPRPAPRWCRDSELNLRRRQEVTIELNGLGEFKALTYDVEMAYNFKTVTELRREIQEHLTKEGYAQAAKLPKWQLAIIHAGVFHALN